MNPNKAWRLGRRGIVLGTLLLLSVAASLSFAYAQVGGGFDLSWSKVDGGGATFSTGGTYELGGTIGQPDAGKLTGGTYTLDGGFWGASAGGPTPTITPVPATIRGHVTWQGRPTQPNALQQLPITLTLKSATGETNYPAQSTDASGFFTASLVGLPAGSYQWRVKNPKYLATTGSASLPGSGQTNVEMGLMRAGDCNNDNVITVGDFNILKGTFGRTQGEPGYDARADFTGDNTVNIGDFNLIRGNFGTSGAPPISPGKVSIETR